MKDEVLAKKAAAEASFNTLTEEKNSLTSRISEIDTELVRLQGEYRAYEAVLNSEKDPANTIVVEEKKDGKSKVR